MVKISKRERNRRANAMPALRIGLTGSMGAGKSEALRAFARLGTRVLDADALGRYALSRLRPVRESVRALLGDAAFGPDGEPCRPAIAAAVFSDGELLKKYEALIQPSIRALWLDPPDSEDFWSFSRARNAESAADCERALAECDARFPSLGGLARLAAERVAKNPPTVVEVPLLFEKKLESDFDFCVDVLCSRKLRCKRLKGRGMSESEISARDAFQLPPEAKASQADAVLFNESDIEFLQMQAALCLLRLI